MHYQIADKIIQSENAAKPASQSNEIVNDFIANLEHGKFALDYGCGKLRYTLLLAQKFNNIIGVDSKIQIERKQTILGQYTSVKDYVTLHHPKIRIIHLEEQEWKEVRYDFILCSNVLSSIPFESIRYEVLANICDLLSNKGQALITVQYRNSYFKSYQNRKDTINHYDGWIIPQKSNYTFYGIIQPESLCGLCNQAGLSIISCFKKDGSAFVVVEKRCN